MSVTPLHGEDANLIGYLLIGNENSARKHSELALKDALAAADEANRAKSEFLSKPQARTRGISMSSRTRAS